MKDFPRKWQSALTFVVAALITLFVSSSIATISNPRTATQEAQFPELPRIISKVKKLEVSEADVQKKGESSVVVLKIKNKSDLAVTAFTVTAGDISFGRDGGVSDETVAVIEPHDTVTLEIPLSSLKEGVPLIIAGVFYVDGTEDGEPATLKVMRNFRAREKDKNAAKKGDNNQ